MKCIKCDANISKKEKRCPECNYNTTVKNNKKVIYIFSFIIIAIITVIAITI